MDAMNLIAKFEAFDKRNVFFGLLLMWIMMHFCKTAGDIVSLRFMLGSFIIYLSFLSLL